MGVITKPDTLSPGSELEMAFINLAQNVDVEFRLGWHVLKIEATRPEATHSKLVMLSEKQFFDQRHLENPPKRNC